MRLIGIAILLTISQVASADISRLYEEKVFICTINSFTDTGDDIEVTFEWSNQNPDDRGTHGGRERSFKQGNDEIVTIANDAWMGAAWWRSGEKIAEAVTVTTERNVDSRVLLLMNPKNDNERIHLDCAKP